jgi:hypothetical protein
VLAGLVLAAALALGLAVAFPPQPLLPPQISPETLAPPDAPAPPSPAPGSPSPVPGGG